MKRKLFTFLVAFLAIAAFNVSAETVGIQAGDSTKTKLNGTPGYAATQTDLPTKLTYAGGKIMYKAPYELCKTTKTEDRFNVVLPDPSNQYLISFSPLNAPGTKLSFTGGNTTYENFTVFQNTGGTSILSAGTNVLVPQAFNGGSFAGYLAANATGTTDHSGLLIVMHDKAGNLSLRSIKQYADSIKALNSGVSYTIDSATGILTITGTITVHPNLYPLWIETIQLSGRWAIPSDFAECKFQQFFYGGQALSVGSNNIFTVKQVDYVLDESTAATATVTTNNIITHTERGAGNFEGLSNQPNKWYGTASQTILNATGTGQVDGIIPLFVLASPQSDCDVLSVSRKNDLSTQSQADGGYANQLELRSYGTYWGYELNAAGTAWSYKLFDAPDPTASADADSIYDTYTSLQKFAIWIDVDGNMELYPAASYFWQYGEPKVGTFKNGLPYLQEDKILPNSVLIYNNIKVSYIVGSSASGNNPDKAYGVKIGWWNGLNTQTPNATGGITTIPNALQSITDYEPRAYKLEFACDDEAIDGKYYFLQVYPDTTGLWRNTVTADAFKKGGYQKGDVVGNSAADLKNPARLHHVLSTQIVGSDKYLSIVPKEIRRESDGRYWRFPYDSVNMAAHWQIVKAGDGYRFINMLGDTLQYNAPVAGYNPVVGSFQVENGLMPGANVAADMGKKYFGRPSHLGSAYTDATMKVAWDDATHWFPASTATATTVKDIWKVHKMKGGDGSFFIELVNGTGPEILLSSDLTIGVKGWYNHNTIAGAAGYYAGNGNYYFQQNTILDVAAVGYVTEPAGIQACPGMKITREEIYYVPTNGELFGEGEDNGVINSTYKEKNVFGPNNASTWKSYSDSLTAYTFLTGFYDIAEADKVENGLNLGSYTVSNYNGTGGQVQAASLKETNIKLEFIKLEQVGEVRKNAIVKAHTEYNAATTFATAPIDSLSWLYGETYKWYIVKSGNKYLSFGWVNYEARTNRETAGFIFVDEIENAVPVRLYQPLVGDKAETNFLFQFYMPKYRYDMRTTTPVGERVLFNNFFNIEGTTLGTIGTSASGSYSKVQVYHQSVADPTIDALNREVCFATLSQHSDFIYATRAYTGLTSGTRFTPRREETPVCECEGEFIAPKWMGEERLLSMPLNNQLWDNVKGELSAVNAWIATGKDDAGIVTNESKDKATTLTHTYVTTIKVYNETGAQSKYNEANVSKVAIPTGTNDTVWIGGNTAATTGTNMYRFAVDADSTPPLRTFETDLKVDLYYIQNAAGKYLTVVPENDMYDPRSTVTDVNGIKLAWRDIIKYEKDTVAKYSQDLRATQLFAISGCKEGKDPYGTFVYLPLASYQFDYSKTTGGIVQKTVTVSGVDYKVNKLFYNKHLGREMLGSKGCPGTDLRDAWRVSQYATVADPVKYLVVFNANSDVAAGSLIPIQVKLSKLPYLHPTCIDKGSLISTIGKVNNGNYVSFNNNNIENADEYSYFAHWNVSVINKNKDEFLYQIKPELQKIYNDNVGEGSFVQNYLNGEYYFIDTYKDGSKEGYIAINIKGYGEGNFTAKFDTIAITCVEHKMPFFDLIEEEFDIYSNKYAILETPFVDRNLTWVINKEKGKEGAEYTTVNNNGYQAYINSILNDYAKAEYVTVYETYRRQIVKDKHIIPYYAISVTDFDGVEYFLNVKKAANTNVEDSVYWTKLTDAERQILTSPSSSTQTELDKKLTDKYKLYQFCLPYKMVEDKATGKWGQEKVEFDGEELSSVYLQTLDLARTDYPFLVVAGSATKYVTARKLDEAIKGNSLDYNIYTVDYKQIDEKKVTGWVFGGKDPNANIWVPLVKAINNGVGAKGVASEPINGVITSVGKDGEDIKDLGKDFIVESGASPLNYAKFTGIKNAYDLKFVFKGDTIIGDNVRRPIWYYNVLSDGKYLTDATDKAAYYQFNGHPYAYAYFETDKLPDEVYFDADGLKVDAKFLQSFGFRYMINDQDEHQRFWIVSNANYKTPKPEADYRYLADINGQLVFVKDRADAMVFQFGKLDPETGYTDLEVVGKGGIYGIAGGVKLMNTTGKVDIYSIDGRLISSTIVKGTETTIAAPRGIVVVKNGANVVKVVVQ